jgi:hypothetical protein
MNISPRNNLLSRSLDLLVLASLAFAQPMLSTLGRNPGFLVAHQTHLVDVLLLLAAAIVVPAAALLGIEALASLLSASAGPIVHAVSITILSAIFFLVLLKDIYPQRNSAVVLAAVMFGGLFAYAYSNWIASKLPLAILSPVLIVFPVSFVLDAPVRRLLFPPKIASRAAHSTTPIVMVVFDEFPLGALLGPDKDIDARYFPNFYALSRRATWYRNTTAVSDSTLYAVPAILDGIRPDIRLHKLPHAADHPHSLFTLLGGAYRMNVHENLTHLCPESLCSSVPQFSLVPRIKALFRDTAVVVTYVILPQRFTRGLPDITQAWANFTVPQQAAKVANFDEDAPNWDDRASQVRDFISSIHADGQPSLNFLHVLLPHGQWEYLPSGQKYRPVARTGIRGMTGANTEGIDPGAWTKDPDAARENYLRFLLQTQFVDKLVGELIARLRSAGLYDKCLLVITADHGTSFRPGTARRTAQSANENDLLWVPLFVKQPGEQEGRTDTRNVETIDILPTVTEILGLSPGYPLSGQSLVSPGWRDRGIKVIDSASGAVVRTGGNEAGLEESLRYKLTTFPGWNSRDGFYISNHYPELLGRRVRAAAPDSWNFQLDWPTIYRGVNLNGTMVPAEISGTIQKSTAAVEPLPKALAAGVDGFVQAVATPYREDGRDRFTLLVPPGSLHNGTNQIELFTVTGPSTQPHLARLSNSNDDIAYHLGSELKFSAGGNAATYQVEGWNEAESGLTWTSAKKSTIFLPMDPPPHDLTLTAQLTTFSSGQSPRSVHVQVFANEKLVGVWKVISAFDKRWMVIPKYLMSEQNGLQLTFVVPEAASPRSLHLGQDQRVLGIAVTSMIIK